ncbi:MAG: hypothetical protein JWL59_4025 [Chthoniobacteraceae bacterium]|nr:hypothetical protein [Chthoniobacteraceae bacterium]
MNGLSDRPLPRILILELWGLGDLSFLTLFLKQVRGEFRVTLVGKAHAAALLRESFPEVEFLEFDAPWTKFRGKYELAKWPWPKLGRLVQALRSRRFDAAVSVRPDPRDHFLMWLTGARQRFGFAGPGSRPFLTNALHRPSIRQHKVEDWRLLTTAITGRDASLLNPWLDPNAAVSTSVQTELKSLSRPLITVHTGAQMKVRRWPEVFFRDILKRIRNEFDVYIALVPDPDGYGAGLADLADRTFSSLNFPELLTLLRCSSVLLCNDSGPGHLAAALGCPTIALFGPGSADWFRPWGPQHHVVIRDICPWRPCFDYCRFPEPICLTRLEPEVVWPEIRTQLCRRLIPISQCDDPSCSGERTQP